MKTSGILYFLITILFVFIAQSIKVDVTGISDYNFMFSDGRYIGVTKYGAEVKYWLITVGADSRTINGHGKTDSNTYKSPGNAQNIKIDILPVEKNDLGLKLQFDRRRINNAVIVNHTVDSNSYARVSNYIDYGLTAELSKKIDSYEPYLLTGLYKMENVGIEVGTVEMLSIGLRKKFSEKYFFDARVDGYRDEFSNLIHFSQRISGKIGYDATDNLQLIISGEVYPRGVPIAGCDLSSVAAVGGLFDNSQIHTNLLAIAGVKLTYTF